jgi:hypothetical protein
VDASNLITKWNTPAEGTKLVLAVNPIEVSWNSTSQFILTATVTATEGTGTPTGTVAFNAGDTILGTGSLTGSADVATATLSANSSALPLGSSSVSALYSGDDNFNGSSTTLMMNASVPSGSQPVVAAITPDPVYESNPDPNGNRWFFTLKIVELAGVGAKLTNLTIDGTSYSSQIVNFFKGTNLAPNGTLVAALAAGSIAVPSTHVFAISGMTATGHAWSQQISVPFDGPAPSR